MINPILAIAAPRFADDQSRVYCFDDYQLLTRACGAVLATLPDAPIDPDVVASLTKTIGYVGNTGVITLTPDERTAFLDCFVVAAETDDDWTNDDYNTVLETLGRYPVLAALGDGAVS